jgi:hypothetical protein
MRPKAIAQMQRAYLCESFVDRSSTCMPLGMTVSLNLAWHVPVTLLTRFLKPFGGGLVVEWSHLRWSRQPPQNLLVLPLAKLSSAS